MGRFVLDCCQTFPGANPTIVSHNASALKIYNATSSLVRFETKNIFFCFERTLFVSYYNVGVVVVNSKVVGFSPDHTSHDGEAVSGRLWLLVLCLQQNSTLNCFVGCTGTQLD
jgi:hypothetical protein